MDKDSIEYLVEKIKSGEDHLFDQLYKGLYSDLRKMAASYFIAGGDEGDILQECQIGLWKAIKDYNNSAGMSFKNFAINVCCKRHLITSVSHANRKKFIIHNSADSLDTPTSEEDDSYLGDFIQDDSESILDKIAADEIYESAKNLLIEKLTKLERSVLELYLMGASYKEIAMTLGIKAKTVDNSLMRARSKAAEVYNLHKENKDSPFSG